MFKTALFDCAINEKCCIADGGRGIGPLFSPPPRGIWQLKSPHPREFAIQGKKKMLMPGGQPWEGGWVGKELGAAGIVWRIIYRCECSTLLLFYSSYFFFGCLERPFLISVW